MLCDALQVFCCMRCIPRSACGRGCGTLRSFTQSQSRRSIQIFQTQPLRGIRCAPCRIKKVFHSPPSTDSKGRWVEMSKSIILPLCQHVGT